MMNEIGLRRLYVVSLEDLPNLKINKNLLKELLFCLEACGEVQFFSWDDEDNEMCPILAEYLSDKFNIYSVVLDLRGLLELVREEYL